MKSAITACKQGIDVLLMQDGHVINYDSRKLKEHENNYATHDMELATIVAIADFTTPGESHFVWPSLLPLQTP